MQPSINTQNMVKYYIWLWPNTGNLIGYIQLSVQQWLYRASNSRSTANCILVYVMRFKCNFFSENSDFSYPFNFKGKKSFLLGDIIFYWWHDCMFSGNECLVRDINWQYQLTSQAKCLSKLSRNNSIHESMHCHHKSQPVPLHILTCKIRNIIGDSLSPWTDCMHKYCIPAGNEWCFANVRWILR